jgi:hypothetical protein
MPPYLLVALTLLTLMATSTDLTPGDHTGTIDVDGRPPPTSSISVG